MLWEYQTGAPIAAAPSVYEQNGIEYVVVTTGGTSTSSQGGKVSQMQAFALGGDPMQFGAPGNQISRHLARGHSEAGHAERKRSGRASSSRVDKTVKNQVDLTVVASLSPANGGLNFNGYVKGEAAYHVPEGWTVQVTFRNLSTQSPHSAVVAPGRPAEQRPHHARRPSRARRSPNYESGITSGSAASSPSRRRSRASMS